MVSRPLWRARRVGTVRLMREVGRGDVRRPREWREKMREFKDERGVVWVASVQEREGDDYKGRFGLEFSQKDDSPENPIPLVDIRWNSPKTAERTLRTMSRVELLRRLKSALGRRA